MDDARRRCGGRRSGAARARIEARADRPLLWDEAAGLYYDYNFRDAAAAAATILRRRSIRCGRGSAIAGAGGARARRTWRRFEAPGGLLTSTTATGSQWDAPFGWAPLQLIAVDGLRRYGFHEDADRIAAKFVSLVAKEFDEHGTIVEKYDVRRRESDRRRRHQVRLQRERDRIRLDQRARCSNCWPACGRRPARRRLRSAGVQASAEASRGTALKGCATSGHRSERELQRELEVPHRIAAAERRCR